MAVAGRDVGNGAQDEMADEVGSAPTEQFLQERRLLIGVAYRILGSYVEAEDVVQDAWLRWDSARPGSIDNPQAWLVTVVTRASIDRLRRAKSRREEYVGPWLPEPVLTEPDVADSVAERDTVSLAMLVVLETLSPLERAVFVLREAFDCGYPEIAEILGRTEPAVRQLAKRAREHVEARASRFDSDRAARARVTQRFLAACTTGDVRTLLDVLAPGVTLVSDTGGQGRAPLRVIEGADKVARFLVAVAAQPLPEMSIDVADVNGVPGLVAYSGEVPMYVAVLDLVDGRVADIKLAANPSKLRGVARRQPA